MRLRFFTVYNLIQMIEMSGYSRNEWFRNKEDSFMWKKM